MKKFYEENCKNSPKYNYNTESNGIYCIKHKKRDMNVVVNR